jgi:hypothetical protein
MNLKLSFLIIISAFVTAVAFAKTKPAPSADKVYVLLDDGGEHPVEKCEAIAKAPQKLKKEKRLESASGYLGSVQTEFSDKNEAGIDMWKHYFNNAKDCQAALASQNLDQ